MPVEKETIKISIAKNFSEYPGGRYKTDGSASGEEFRDRILIPKLKEASQKDTIVEVNFDDVCGFGSSFLEEAFGGLIRSKAVKPDLVNDRLKLTTENEDVEDFVDLAYRYIKEAVKMSQ